jgi:branched-chain amino acid transport system substrate-binding protein
MNRPPWPAIARLCAAAAISLTLGACSSETAVSSGGASPGGGFKGTVTVGAIAQYTGPLSSGHQKLPEILSAWASTVNAAGGINGYRVHVITEDVGSVPTAGPADVQALIANDHVAAIVDDVDPNDATWMPYATSMGVPVITGLPNVASLLYPDQFNPFVSYPGIFIGLAQTAKSEGGKVGLAVCAELAECAEASTLFGLAARPTGVDVATSVRVPDTTADFTAVCQQLKGAGVTALYNGIEGAPGQKLSDTCYQQGVGAKLLLTANGQIPAWNSDSVYRNTTVIDFAAPYFDTSVQGVRAYRDALKKYAPGVIGTQDDDSLGVEAWASAELFKAAALAAGGEPTARSVATGLYELRGETLDGLIAPTTFTRNATHAAGCYFTWSIGPDGQHVVPTAAAPRCPPAALISPVTEAVEKALATGKR